MTELVIDHGARDHSAIGGSSAKRVMACPGSVALCARYPNTASEFAEEGTAMHEAIDLILQGKTEKDTDVVGLVLNGYTITEEMFDDGIRPALDTFDALDHELGGIDFFNEQRVVFPDIDGAFGTVDIVGQARDRSVVLDWKFGRGVAVEAEGNEQLMYYAYAAAHTPPTDRFFDRHKPIEVFIVQPRVNDGEPFTRWMTTWMQLEAFALELRKAVALAAEPDAPLALGPHCKFCPAKVGCPLYQNQVRAASGLTREEMEAHMTEWLPWADTMIAWGNEIKELAHGLLEQGASIPGYKLVNKRATRAWKDEAAAARHMAKVGLPAKDRYVKKLLSPAAAETALKKAGLPAELPARLVDKTSSGTTLAPESDKRPAVVVAPEALRLLADRLSAS